MSEHFPAGWASPDQHEAQQRQIMRELILREREQAARAELEAEVDRRIAAARGPAAVQQKAPVVDEPAADHDAQHEPVSD